MTRKTRRSYLRRWVLPAMLAVSLGSMLAGCHNPRYGAPDTLGSRIGLPPAIDPQARMQAKAFKNRVEADRSIPHGPMAKQ